MNLLIDYAVYPKSPSQVSSRRGLRTSLPQWELGLKQEEILIAIEVLKSIFLSKRVKLTDNLTDFICKTGGLKIEALYLPCIQLIYCLCLRKLTKRSHFKYLVKLSSS